MQKMLEEKQESLRKKGSKIHKYKLYESQHWASYNKNQLLHIYYWIQRAVGLEVFYCPFAAGLALVTACGPPELPSSQQLQGSNTLNYEQTPGES